MLAPKTCNCSACVCRVRQLPLRSQHACLPACCVSGPQALGLKPKAPPSSRRQPALEKHEVDKLLKGGAGGDDEQPAALEGERVKGLGFGSG